MLLEKFGGMYRAFRYGAPPHGGIAPGVDRIVMLLAGEENLREVMLFPMNQRAEDLMMGAPARGDAEAASRSLDPPRYSGEVGREITSVVDNTFLHSRLPAVKAVDACGVLEHGPPRPQPSCGAGADVPLRNNASPGQLNIYQLVKLYLTPVSR